MNRCASSQPPKGASVAAASSRAFHHPWRQASRVAARRGGDAAATAHPQPRPCGLPRPGRLPNQCRQCLERGGAQSIAHDSTPQRPADPSRPPTECRAKAPARPDTGTALKKSVGVGSGGEVGDIRCASVVLYVRPCPRLREKKNTQKSKGWRERKISVRGGEFQHDGHQWHRMMVTRRTERNFVHNCSR